MKSKPWYLLPSPSLPSLLPRQRIDHTAAHLFPLPSHTFGRKTLPNTHPCFQLGICWYCDGGPVPLPVGANGCQWVPLQMGLETIFCHLTIFCCSTRQNFWGLSVTENFTWCQLFFSSLTTLMRVVLVGKVDTIVMPLWCHCDATACDDTTDWRSSKCCWSVAGSSLAPRKDRLLENLE